MGDMKASEKTFTNLAPSAASIVPGPNSPQQVPAQPVSGEKGAKCMEHK